MKTTHTLLAAAILLTVTSTVQAALIPALSGQVVNDTDLNVTWLSNANLAATNTFGLATGVDLGMNAGVTNYGPSIINSNGTMTWGGALKWIGAMNAANYLGYHDWRLPVSDTCANLNCTGSEMGHLFYNELGGVAGQSITATHNANYGLFQNLQPLSYWSGTVYVPNANLAWIFAFNPGAQGTDLKNDLWYALAVRPGQVAAIPAPAAAWLLGSGLLGLIGVARHKLCLIFSNLTW